MRRLVLTLMLLLALLAWVALPAMAQGPFDGPPTEQEACEFVADQGAPIGEDCEPDVP